MSFWSSNKNNFKFVNSNEKINQASFYATNIIRSDIDKVNFKLNDDVQKAINGGTLYMRNYLCENNDFTIFNKLKNELDESKIVNWSKHKKLENPKDLPTFNEIINKLSKDFNIKISETRLNYYKDGQDYKPFHQDRNAFYNNKNEYTLGASFGCPRKLDFKHIDSDKIFSFPQNNGDIFGFTTEINKLFMHGVPKSNSNYINNGERFSIIIWGEKN